MLLAAALVSAGCGRPETPVPHAPGAVIADGQLGTPVLLANGQSTVYARIRLSTLPRPQRPRGPVNVALAIDTSGSMEGAPIEEARKAALRMIDALKDGDRLAVVAFHSKTEILLPATELSQEVRGDVKQRVAAMRAQGTTDMAAGLSAAVNQVREHFSNKGVNRVVLLGDGIPNAPGGIVDVAQQAAREGIAVTTLGLGLDYDETLMGQIAQASGGRFRYIEGAEKVADIFAEELAQIDGVYGRNATVVIKAGPGVRIDAVVGGRNSDPSSTVYVPLGDIARGDTRDVVVRMTVTPRKAGVPIELLDAEISFEDALEGAGRQELRVYLGAHTTTLEAEVAKAKNPEVELSAALAEASATTLQALELAKNGRYQRAREMLTSGSQAARAQAEKTPSAELKKHADDMAAVASDMPQVDTPAAAPEEPSGYNFEDDAAPSAATPEAPVSPTVAKRRKMVHAEAMDALGH
ncbi:MAG: VWA domain-containing protein [Polyangiaceae bacterium]